MSEEIRLDGGVIAFVEVRDEDGREWTATALLSPLTAKDGSGDRMDAPEMAGRPMAITAFRVVLR